MSVVLIPFVAGDYKMIESLTVENFRCFESVEIHDLKRINVLVGRNASGKTALLEAIFMASAGHAEVALRMRSWRLLGQAEIKLEREAVEALWRDMFFGFDLSKFITISIKGTPQSTQTVRVFNTQAEAVFVPIGEKTVEVDAVFPIVFERIDGEGKKVTLPVKLTGEGMSVKVGGSQVKAAFYPSGFKPDPKEAAGRFSELSKKKLETRVITTLQRVYPFIESLSVENVGGEYHIFASVAGLPEKMPVSLISEGVYKLMSVLLGIAATHHGAVLIDEIENGFYFETLPDIWKLLLEFAEEYKTQLFISTHSLEAIKALLPTLEGNEGKFTLMRTDASEGKGAVRQFTGMNFRRAIEQKIEIR